MPRQPQISVRAKVAQIGFLAAHILPGSSQVNRGFADDITVATSQHGSQRIPYESHLRNGTAGECLRALSVGRIRATDEWIDRVLDYPPLIVEIHHEATEVPVVSVRVD